MIERVQKRGSASGAAAAQGKARSAPLLAIAAGLALLGTVTGCPDDPYKAATWTKKLGETHEAERAVTELEQLGDPSAIEPIGNAWAKQGKPGRWLQVIISLARPMTAQEASDKNFTDYVASGRPQSWDKALPFLKQALGDVDESNARSVESAIKAAEALGEARHADGLDVLIEIAQRPVTKKLVTAQVAALRAIGKYASESAKASAALIRVVDREPPPHPRTANAQNRAAADEKYTLHLGITGAAVNALGELHVAAAAKPLVIAMYRLPDLFTPIRRALVASGPLAGEELRKVLAGTHAEVNQLFKDKRLGVYCGDRNEVPVDQCQKVSAKTFYAAVVLGDFYDPKSVPELLAALKEQPAPIAFADEQPSPTTQHNALFETLRKIGAAEAAAPVRALWAGHGGPAGKRTPAEIEAERAMRLLAISAYAYLARDEVGVDELAKIASDNEAEASLRQESALAFARLARDAKDIAVLDGLAQKYLEASAKKRVEADSKKPAADAADKEFEKAKKAMEEAKAAAVRVSHDASKSVDEIKAAAAAATKADEDFKKNAKKAHREAAAPFKAADATAKQFKGFARMFQTHIARVEIAIRCRQDLACYAASLSLTPDQAAANVAAYIKDLKAWTKDEKMGLLEANIERAMLELGKRGTKASSFTDALLDSAKSDDRLIRQAILLALPKIAAVPCKTCEAKLQAAIKSGEGKTTLADLNLETTMMRNYFGWAGGNTPSTSAAPEPADEPSRPAPKKK